MEACSVMNDVVHCKRCDAPDLNGWHCGVCGYYHEPDEKFIEVKGGTRLSAAEAKTALEQAMEIIDSVGTTGVCSQTRNAVKWMQRYFPNWA